MRSERSIEGAILEKIQSKQETKKGRSGTRKKNQVLILFGSIGEQNMIFLFARILERRIIHHSNDEEGQTITVRNARRRDIIKQFARKNLTQ